MSGWINFSGPALCDGRHLSVDLRQRTSPARIGVAADVEGEPRRLAEQGHAIMRTFLCH